jgi:putative hydrolase of HD superfamily
MNKERFEKQIAFILEADKEKNILRQTHITGYARRENDAEHAWHMAMMIYLLKEYSNEEFDVAKAMMMALIHDIVEIDAGDTYAYDTAALVTQKEREERAAERIYGLLPDDQRDELRALFEEFEAGESAEARFAKTMDNFQPLLLNDSNGGADWREHKVTKSQVVGRQQKSVIGSKDIWEYTSALIDKNVQKGNIILCLSLQQ